MQEVRTLFGATMDDLPMGETNERINDLAGTGIMWIIIIIIRLAIHILPLKSGLKTVPNMVIWLIRYKL